MIHYSTESAKSKKAALIELIDAMTAAAIDRSSQSHIQFLQMRSKLIDTIDKSYKEEELRINSVKSAIKQLNEALPGIF